MRKVLADQVRKEYPEAEWPAMEKALKAFSMIPPKMNLRAVMNGLLEEQVVGSMIRTEKALCDRRPMAGSELLSGLGVEDFQIGDVYILPRDWCTPSPTSSSTSGPCPFRTRKTRTGPAPRAAWWRGRYVGHDAVHVRRHEGAAGEQGTARRRVSA